MSTFDHFADAVRAIQPESAVVLGSGLGAVAAGCVESHAISYADIPGLPAPGVAGHAGHLGLGTWAGHTVLVCRGRVHGYEGHPPEVVTRLVRQLGAWGVRHLILTNAAGGIRADLNPGDLMLIGAHRTLLGPADWRGAGVVAGPYSAEWRAAVAAASGCPVGAYAALTGPAYETPAEIRALAAMGADAVGMSTAREADAAHELGMSVLGVSCITNKAAGLGAGILSHAEVEATGRAAAAKLARLVEAALGEANSAR